MAATSSETAKVQLTANKPAQFRKAVVFCCDDNYLPFAAHAAAQICQLHKDRDFDICICCGEGQTITLPSSLDDLSVRVCHISAASLFDDVLLSPGRSAVVYLRLCLPSVFSEEYDRILYLDSDIFVQGGDFSALLDLDIGPNCVAAIRDNDQWRTPLRVIKGAKLPGQPMARYFNSGVMLMDVDKYNDFGLMDKCIALGSTVRKNDQNLYNSVLQGKWSELSPIWNWQFTWASRFFAALKGPNIVHFIGPVKPWKDPTGQFEPRFINAIYRFTKQHFPDFPIQEVAADRLAPDSRMVTKMLFKHLLSRRKMARYLARFPDELTVHE